MGEGAGRERVEGRRVRVRVVRVARESIVGSVIWACSVVFRCGGVWTSCETDFGNDVRSRSGCNFSYICCYRSVSGADSLISARLLLLHKHPLDPSSTHNPQEAVPTQALVGK